MLVLRRASWNLVYQRANTDGGDIDTMQEISHFTSLLIANPDNHLETNSWASSPDNTIVCLNAHTHRHLKLKGKFCHYLLTLMLFKTNKNFFHEQKKMSSKNVDLFHIMKVNGDQRYHKSGPYGFCTTLQVIQQICMTNKPQFKPKMMPKVICSSVTCNCYVIFTM